MSSFINKSKKTFKPKAPQARRHETSVSAASSIRGSQEPQRPTPQPRVRSPELQRPLASERPVSQVLSTPPPTQQPLLVQDDQEANRAQIYSNGDAADGSPPRKRARITADTTLRPVPPAANIQITQNTPPPTQQKETVVTRPRATLTDDTPERGASALLQLSQDSRRPEAQQDSSPTRVERTDSSARVFAISSNHQGVVEQTRRSTRSRTAIGQKATAESPEKRQDALQRGGQRLRKTKDAPQREDNGETPTGPIDITGTGTSAEVIDEDDNEQITNPLAGVPSVSAIEKTLPGKIATKKKAKSRTETTKKTSRIKPRRKLTAEEQADAIVAAATNPKPRSKPKAKQRKRKNAAVDSATVLDGEDVGTNGQDADTPAAAAPKRRKRARSATPEDGETQEVDPNFQKLGDLPQLKIGRLGPREQKLRERDKQQATERQEKRQAAARAELEEFMGLDGDELTKAMDEKTERDVREKTEMADQKDRERIWRMEDEGQWSDKPPGRWGRHKAEEKKQASTEENSNGHGSRDRENGDSEREDSPFEVFSSSVPAFRIVDGKIVADPNARALDLPTVSAPVEQREQTDIDRRVTEASFRHRETRPRWDEAKLALFYEGLRRWGTDFGMVATWVPGMSRNQVKRKYTQEEKAHPDQITEALKKENRIATTLEEIEEKRGRPLSDPKAWQEDVDKRVAEMKEKARVEREAAEELMKNRGISKGNQAAAAATGGQKGNGTVAVAGDGDGDEDDGEDVSLRPVAATTKKGRGKAKGRYRAEPEVVNYTF